MQSWLLRNIPLHGNDSPAEERANGATHLLGVLLSAVGLVALVVRAATQGEPVDVVGAVVYGLAMLALYTSSAGYHLSTAPVRKRLFRVLDHSSIFLLIAGTYTPLCLGVGGVLGWGMFALIWTFAAVGIFLKLRFWGRFRILNVVLYVLCGWTVVVAWKPFVAAVPAELFWWALAGGVTYTAGTLVYSAKRLRYHHAIWHLFVLVGSACFYVGIYRNVLLI